MTDPYEVLGIDRTAGLDEIKREYRKIARACHPDVNPGPAAAVRFKAVSRAYAVLADERSRALYDEFGEASLQVGFNAVFERERRKMAAAKGPNGSPFGDLSAFQSAFDAVFGDDPPEEDDDAPGPADGPPPPPPEPEAPPLGFDFSSLGDAGFAERTATPRPRPPRPSTTPRGRFAGPTPPRRQDDGTGPWQPPPPGTRHAGRAADGAAADARPPWESSRPDAHAASHDPRTGVHRGHPAADRRAASSFGQRPDRGAPREEPQGANATFGWRSDPYNDVPPGGWGDPEPEWSPSPPPWQQESRPTSGNGVPDGFHHGRTARPTPDARAGARATATIDAVLAITGGMAMVSVTWTNGHTDTVRLLVRPGVATGDVIHTTGQRGESLALHVVIAEHPHLRRHGDDVELDVPITVLEAVQGGPIIVPTPTGPARVQLPPKCAGQRLRLRGRGVQRAEGAGNLILLLKVVMPDHLDATALEAIRLLERSYRTDPRERLRL